MTEALLVGLDVGTTALKAVLVTAAGDLVARASRPYPLLTPRPGWTEQDPEEWARAAESAMHALAHAPGVDPSRIAGIGVAGQMHGTVFLDAAGRVVRNAPLWNDQRTGAECDEIEERFGGRAALVAATGNLALTGFSAPKLLWLRKNEPDAWKRTATVLLPKDFVRYRMTGELATDVSDASGTLLLDVRARSWSARALSCLDLDARLLPPVHESPTVVGRLARAFADATGVPAGTPVVAGAGDQAAGAVGTGNVAAGTITVALGTSGVVFASGDRVLADPEGRLHAFCHAAPGLWHAMGVMLSAGGSLEWLRGVLSPPGAGESFEAMTALARAVPPGSDGLVFHPYLAGARTPINDPAARGMFFGLAAGHGRGHLVRAVMEGVVCGLLDGFDLLAGIGAPIRRVIATGGGAKDQTWCGILADALGREVETVDVDEGPALGAALLAAVGAKLHPDVAAACRAAVRPGRPILPDPANRARYAALHDRYRDLRAAVRGFYR
jgi:xylulokinase